MTNIRDRLLQTYGEGVVKRLDAMFGGFAKQARKEEPRRVKQEVYKRINERIIRRRRA